MPRRADETMTSRIIVADVSDVTACVVAKNNGQWIVDGEYWKVDVWWTTDVEEETMLGGWEWYLLSLVMGGGQCTIYDERGVISSIYVTATVFILCLECGTESVMPHVHDWGVLREIQLNQELTPHSQHPPMFFSDWLPGISVKYIATIQPSSSTPWHSLNLDNFSLRISM